jgi:hypothetical protein
LHRAEQRKQQREQQGTAMTIHLASLIALIAGILILVMPKLLNYIVAVYLIFIGVMGLFGAGTVSFR